MVVRRLHLCGLAEVDESVAGLAFSQIDESEGLLVDHVFGVGGGELAEDGKGVFKFADAFQSHAEGEGDGGIAERVLIVLHELVGALKGFGGPVQGKQGVGKIEEAVGVSGFDLEGFLKALHRFLLLAFAGVDAAQIPPGAVFARALRDGVLPEAFSGAPDFVPRAGGPSECDDAERGECWEKLTRMNGWPAPGSESVQPAGDECEYANGRQVGTMIRHEVWQRHETRGDGDGDEEPKGEGKGEAGTRLLAVTMPQPARANDEEDEGDQSRQHWGLHE